MASPPHIQGSDPARGAGARPVEPLSAQNATRPRRVSARTLTRRIPFVSVYRVIGKYVHRVNQGGCVLWAFVL